MDASADVVVGRIVKPHGIRGEVSIEVLSDVPGRFDPGVELRGAGRTFTVAAARTHQGRALVRFEGVTTRNDAELLRGIELNAPAADLSDADTFYVHELVGLAVRLDADGTDLGTVTALIELPSAAGYDLLEVGRADGSTWLLPAADDYVEIVEDEASGDLHIAVVDPPEGLVDPEAT